MPTLYSVVDETKSGNQIFMITNSWFGFDYCIVERILPQFFYQFLSEFVCSSEMLFIQSTFFTTQTGSRYPIIVACGFGLLSGLHVV